MRVKGKKRIVERSARDSSAPSMVARVNRVFWITCLLLAVHFLFNFLSLPVLKWFYLVEVIAAFAVVLLFEAEDAIIPILGLFFIEGQGRVLFEYDAIMRNIFDILLFVAIVKAFLQKGKFMPFGVLHPAIIILMVLHFLWYVIQLFNIYSAGTTIVFVASKIYLFPFIIFLFFLVNPVNDKERMAGIRNFVIVLFAAESFLTFFQASWGESVMYALSPYYKTVLRDIFIGDLFRPLGTSFYPGAFSAYFFAFIGAIFLVAGRNWFVPLLRPLLVLLVVPAIYMTRVRSAMIKYLLIVGLSFLAIILSSKNRVRNILILVFAALFFSGFWYVSQKNIETFLQTPDVSDTVQAVKEYYDPDTLSKRRIGPDMLLTMVFERLRDNPMGLGPGRTGAAAGFAAKQEVIADPIYTREKIWSYDNLILSLAIDLGVGMIFYFLLIIIIPLLILIHSFKALRQNKLDSFRVLAISGITCIIILLGNWGSVGLPYNPESFAFWFWAALGLAEYSKMVHDA